MKEKLNEYALVAEILSAAAIVISLVFVGIQIKQNSRVSEVAAFQDLTAQLVEFNLLIAQDETIRDGLFKVRSGAELNQNEILVVRSVFTGMVRHGEMAFLQYRSGFINESQLRSALLPVTGSWSNPAMQSTFMILSGFNEEYQEYVLSLMNDQ